MYTTYQGLIRKARIITQRKKEAIMIQRTETPSSCMDPSHWIEV